VVDYFSLGAVCYEFMNGQKPYIGKTRKEMKAKIREKEIKLDKTNLKEGWSLEAADFINQLLKRAPQKRLGYIGGITELKKHAWFKDINWKDLYNGLLKAPYVPFGEDNFEHSFCKTEEVIKEDTEQRYQEIMKSIEYKNMFDDYYYFNRYDAKTQGLKMLYFNIHEKIYKAKPISRLNTGNITVNKKYQNMKIPLKPGFKRGMSPMGAMPNKAFNEANKFIIKRKNRSKQKLEIPKLKLNG